jgi:hypothetical protein
MKRTINGAELEIVPNANLCGANLCGADLCGASFRGANLCGANGNMREVKTAQFDCWPITWTQSPDDVHWLQIGCQRHELTKWQAADPRWIAAMDCRATEWWAKYGRIVIEIVELSPAVPWGAGIPVTTKTTPASQL